jgi:DNA-binding MarR family transcriptional regulator
LNKSVLLTDLPAERPPIVPWTHFTARRMHFSLRPIPVKTSNCHTSLNKKRQRRGNLDTNLGSNSEPNGFGGELTSRPGFLVRRLHQIHISLFGEECAAFDVTPVQFSIMSVVAQRPGLDQSQISEEVGVDRATLANVVARLEAAGLLRRAISRLDRRQKLLTLTARGKNLMGRMQAQVAHAHARTIEALSAEEQAQFMALLSRLVDAGNAHGRAKLRLK